jgi:hypothetical protein
MRIWIRIRIRIRNPGVKELSQLVDQVEPARLHSLLGKKKEKHLVTGRETSWFSSWTCVRRSSALPARGPGGTGQARLTPRLKEGETYSNWQGGFMVQFMDLCEKELFQLVDQVEPARLDSLLGKRRKTYSNWEGDFMVQFMDLCEKELSQVVDQVEPARLDSLLGNRKEKNINSGCYPSSPL